LALMYRTTEMPTTICVRSGPSRAPSATSREAPTIYRHSCSRCRLCSIENTGHQQPHRVHTMPGVTSAISLPPHQAAIVCRAAPWPSKITFACEACRQHLERRPRSFPTRTNTPCPPLMPLSSLVFWPRAKPSKVRPRVSASKLRPCPSCLPPVPCIIRTSTAILPEAVVAAQLLNARKL
jgi:hypothetical protein